MKLKTFHKGGIHIPENKLTSGEQIIDLPAPREVVVTFSQHIGAMAVSCVKVGDKVKKGDMIAKANGAVSANIHTPISGTVKKIGKGKTAFGYAADTVTIEATEEDAQQDAAYKAEKRTESELEKLTSEEIKSIIAEAGIVGLGGATFPTKVKLSPPSGMKAEVLIVNGVECEPYLTNDDALMQECAEEIVEGIVYIMKAANVGRAIVGIENNKPEAIAAMERSSIKNSGITIQPLTVKYPQGSEKQLIEAITGKEVPSGGLPIATGAIVQNVATAYAVCRAVKYKEPLTSRVITVTGPGVRKAGNYRVSLGTPLKTVIEAAGGIPEKTGKVILGGPMMGKAIVALEAPTIKGVSGILILPESESHRKEIEPCIRCGACVRGCPMGLEPYLFMPLAEHEEWAELQRHGVMNCMECGSCSYQCPANRPLVDYIRLGKTTVGQMLRAKKL